MTIISYKDILPIIYFLIPGFITLRTSKALTSNKEWKENKDINFYFIILFSLISYLLVFYPTRWNSGSGFLNFRPSSSELIWICFTSLVLGVIISLYYEKVQRKLFNKLNDYGITGFTGNRPVWDDFIAKYNTVKPQKKAGQEKPHKDEPQRPVEVYLKNGLVISGLLLLISHYPYEEALCIEPSEIYYLQINKNFEAINGNVLPFKASSIKKIDFYKALYINRDEIRLVTFRNY